jgi:hypothetical protein
MASTAKYFELALTYLLKNRIKYNDLAGMLGCSRTRVLILGCFITLKRLTAIYN